MANCPNPKCRVEFVPSPDHLYCDGCGQALAPPRAAARRSGAGGGAAGPEPLVAAGIPSPGGGGTKVIGVGEGPTAGGNIIYNAELAVYCACGHEQLFKDRIRYQCPECHRDPVCDRHYDEARGLCFVCRDKQMVACFLCDERLSREQTFTCSRCHRVAGVDHRDPERGWCSQCVERWAVIVQAISKDEVGISGGSVVTGGEVKVANGQLQTKDGKPVATIKPTTWYAVPKQWHAVKPKLLDREKQAMARFYPAMAMGTTDEGDLCWQGSVTTWTGKAYEIMLRYPRSFPFLPPKAFVLNPKISQSRHIYKDGHLCLFHRDDKVWQPETTAATVVSWVSLWLHCYEAWLETGDWPSREHDQLVVTTEY